MDQLAALTASPPEKARVIPLSVAGAFHTEHMAPAVDVLAGYATISTHDARPPHLQPTVPRSTAVGRCCADSSPR